MTHAPQFASLTRALVGWSVAVVILLAASSAHAQQFYPKETETYLINYSVASADPASTTMLSTFVGFGAGHFYAGRDARGVTMLVGQVVGLGMLLLGPQIDKDGGTLRDIFVTFGGLMFAGFRIADIYLAPLSAREHNAELARRLKIKYLAMPLRNGPGPALAWANGIGVEVNW